MANADILRLRNCLKILWNFLFGLKLSGEQLRKLKNLARTMDKTCTRGIVEEYLSIGGEMGIEEETDVEDKMREKGVARVLGMEEDSTQELHCEPADDDECISQPRHEKVKKEIEDLIQPKIALRTSGPAKMERPYKTFFVNPPFSTLTAVVVEEANTTTSVVTVVADVLIIGKDIVALLVDADTDTDTVTEVVITLGTVEVIAEALLDVAAVTVSADSTIISSVVGTVTTGLVGKGMSVVKEAIKSLPEKESVIMRPDFSGQMSIKKQ
ncbi:hypothetical protein GWI33_009687 [Rhynchophorus ferrugineus]|uniref:Uncharacterized protein n=1 Tax=Rhynchophorus ferrugineus TaxID=354439 RepID=A0A834MFX1_RHYFE|nr:hypothetical protein GWI33_009687 [Rhynchophorus ferrugineus]